MNKRSGIIIGGTDERGSSNAKQAPVRVALIGELPPGFNPTDYVERALEERRARNASALYLRVGRWGVWLYWRRRPKFANLRWFEFHDWQKEHVALEGSKA